MNWLQKISTQWLGDKQIAFRSINLARVEQVMRNGFKPGEHFTPVEERAVFYANFNRDHQPGAIFECYVDSSRSAADMNDATQDESNQAYNAIRSAVYDIVSSVKSHGYDLDPINLESFIGYQVGEGIAGHYDKQPASLWLFISQELNITPFQARDLVSPGVYGDFITLDNRGVFGSGVDVPSGQMTHAGAVLPEDIIAIYLHSSLLDQVGWKTDSQQTVLWNINDYVSVIPAQIDELKEAIDEQLSQYLTKEEDDLYDELFSLSKELGEKQGAYEDMRETITISGHLYRKLMSGSELNFQDFNTTGKFIKFEYPKDQMKILFLVRKATSNKFRAG